MLQPVQLKEVAVRYAAEIEELRAFLTKAGFAAGSAETFSLVASRLQQDRAFHRDLILHVWVLIDRCGGTVSHSDLLGVLAIAAAGEQFAAQASEDDAHDLLRFIMEAQRSMDAPTSRPAAPIPYQRMPPREEVAAVTVPTEAQRPAVFPSTHVASEAGTSARTHPAEQEGRSRLAWALALVLFLVAVASIAIWRYQASPSTQGRNPAPIISAPDAGSGANVLPQSASNTSPIGSSETDLRSRSFAPGTQPAASVTGERAARRARETPAAAASMSPYSVPRTASSARADGSFPAPVVRTPATAGNATAPASSADRVGMSAPVLVRPGTARPAVPVPVPASTLSKQLGSSSIPAYSSLPDDDATTDGRKYPRLLRRRTSGGGNNLVAELRTPAATNLSSGNSAVIPVGVVRPTSLGIMAGNLLYSPTPAYPVAAAAAHVQGEVKVQAEIDRDGNVVAARVVSGPPMLRDAAVDAIQHWRYKPWTAGGKPVATSALAVVDFQLP